MLLVGALGLASAGSLFRVACEQADRPTRADVQDAAAFLQAQHLTDDDIVLVAPPWSFSALQELGREPAIGARILPADGPFERLHHRRHRRVFVWREPDAEPWLIGRASGLMDLTAAPASVTGRISIHAVDDVPARFDLLRRFADVRVAVVGGPDCTERSGGYAPVVRCPTAPRGTKVGLEWAQVTENGQPVVVVSVPPGPGLRIEVDDVDVGERLIVAAGYTRPGLARVRQSGHTGGVVTMRVLVDDVEVGRVVATPSFRVEPHRRHLVERFVGERDRDGGFEAVTLETSRQRGAHRRLAFELSTDAVTDLVSSIGVDAFVPGL
jgi:hypothetical protein